MIVPQSVLDSGVFGNSRVFETFYPRLSVFVRVPFSSRGALADLAFLDQLADLVQRLGRADA